MPVSSVASAGTRDNGFTQRRRRALPRLWKVALIGLGCAYLANALAGWRDDYARGLEAIHDGKWSEARRYMQSAAADNATPAKRVRLYGQRYETYAPQHYAGLAAYKLGDCSAALRYWDVPAAKAFSASTADLGATESRARSDCATRNVASTQPSTPATSPSVTPTEPPAKSPESVPKPSSRSPAIVRTPPHRPTPKPVVQPPRPPSPAEILRPLLDAYLAGKYDEVIRLSGRIKADGTLRWHAEILRAAAAYREAGLGDDDALAIARAAIGEARKADPNRRPDPAFFSPHFLAFFNGK
ncbi:MAG: hypothetical protein WB784_08855 [Rhodanobacteraceae bacterium]